MAGQITTGARTDTAREGLNTMGYSEATIIASSFVVPPEGEAAALRTLTERLLGGGERLFDNSDGALDNLDRALGGYGCAEF